MTKSLLLLDIDGVLIRDRVLLDHVKNNIVRYVSKKMPGTKKPAHLNNLLYKAYGHTGIGLREEYGIDTRDFDDYVYNRYLIAHLCDYIQNDLTFKKDSFFVRNMCHRGQKIAFFSNAPPNWTEPIRDAIDLRIQNTQGNLKPKIESYLKFDSNKNIVFVDDKIENLIPPLMLENWTPIHYNGNSQQLKNIHDIQEICRYL